MIHASQTLSTGKGPKATTEHNNAPDVTVLHHTPLWSQCLLPLQCALKINSSGDQYEHEANRLADQLMETPFRASACRTLPRVHHFTRQPAGKFDLAPASVARALASSSRSLDLPLQQEMGLQFGYDFSRVRVHSGADAERSAQDVGANAYTVGHDIVFGANQFAPGLPEGRRLIAHELVHVMQQSRAGGIDAAQGSGKADLAQVTPISSSSLQRQTTGGDQAQPTPNLMKIYSFGPTGAGRVQRDTGREIFPPKAPVDADGNELVRAGTAAEPKLFRFSRYFTLDDRHQPFPPPIPTCSVKALTEWTPDDGSGQSKDQQEDLALTYYEPGEPLGSKLGTEFIFQNDRPGVLVLEYVFNCSRRDLLFLVLTHGIHFVSDPTAPLGATALVDKVHGPEPAAALPETKAAPNETTNGTAERQPQNRREALPPPPLLPLQNPPPELARRINVVTELIKKASDAAKKDALISELRDLLSKVQPLMPQEDAKQKINDAIGALIKSGADAGIAAILKGIFGKSPSTMPENRDQIGPYVPQKDLGTHLFQGPELTIPDTPKRRVSLHFEFQNGPKKSYEAGDSVEFKVIPPDNFRSLQGAGEIHLVIVAESERNSRSAEPFDSYLLESASPKQVNMTAPETPGKYVIRVNIRGGFEEISMQEFEVTAPQKK